MEYNKEDLIKEALKRLDTIDEILKDCQESINAISAEKQTARYLLYLGCEKGENKLN